MALPTVMTIDGLSPQSPTDLRNQLITSVAAVVPGYTADLPASLIEDVSSTDVAAVALMDSARVETVNSLTPYGANAFTLNQLGNQAGIPPNKLTNTSVNCVFATTAGWVVPKGLVVGDGTNQYVVQDSTIVPASGVTLPVFCVSTTPGSFAVAHNTVTEILSSTPNTLTITVTNPQDGIPGQPAESEESYRVRVLEAGQSVSTGMPTTMRTKLRAVPGVVARLVSIQQQAGGGWSIICGGGDPYQVANAIFLSLFDISLLVGSGLSATAITKANPAVVTTNMSHGLSTGSTIQLNGVVGMTQMNGVNHVVTVLTPTTFSLNVDSTAFGTYTSGGTISPNPRNQVVTINDYPDQYTIPFVTPLQQQVGIHITWNTTSTNVVSDDTVVQLMQPVVVAYINSLVTGQYINTLQLDAVIQAALAPVIPVQLLDRLVYAVTLDGVTVNPNAGTGIIPGSAESYFNLVSTNVVIVRG